MFFILFLRFDHYAKLHDVQTLAMLACVFQEHCLQFEQKPKKPVATPTINSHGNNNNQAAVSRAVMGGSPPKRFHGQTPPTPTQTHPSSPWGSGSVTTTSPISGSWHEVSETDLLFHEVEDQLQEEQPIHEAKCK